MITRRATAIFGRPNFICSTRATGAARAGICITPPRRGRSLRIACMSRRARALDPLGPYTFKAKLQTDAKDEFYAIDGTVAIRLPNGQLVFAWCGRPSPYGQGIFISKMTNPWTLAGRAHRFGCRRFRLRCRARRAGVFDARGQDCFWFIRCAMPRRPIIA